MRYFIGKVKLETEIKPHSEKGVSKLNQLAAKSLAYIGENRNGFLGCVTNAYKQECTFIFAGNGDDKTMQREIAAFWNSIGFDGKILQTTEVCADSIRKELRMGHVDLPCEVGEWFDVDSYRHIDADEHIAKPKSNLTLSEYAKKHHFPELEAEAERIRICAETSAFLGHPVHYIIEENNRKKAEETIDLLIDTLYKANRLQSARMIMIDPDTFNRTAKKPLLSYCYQNFSGGTIVMSLSAAGSNKEYADAAEDIIEKVCQFAIKYRHEVLTVFHIPQHNTEARRAISAYLNNELTMITFSEASADYEESVSYMKTLCAEKGIQNPESFIDKIDIKQTAFYTSEIEAIFHENYTANLKQEYFPAYLKCQNTAKKQEKIEGKAADTLHDMIGLDKVKNVIEEAVSYYKLQKLYQEREIHLNTPARSMVFTGNPGTAKTTVARLTAKIFKDNGLIESGNIVEVGRANLVGKYVGWTAPTVKAAFQRAKGSILFIDEAYSLVDDRDGLYGDEAINTIVQEMENYREDTIVIFAGYPDKMEQFLQKNPGLRSRIAFHVDFPDYTPEELLDILKLMANNQSMKLDSSAEDAALVIFRNAVGIPDFGNGRYVRNLLEQAQMRMSRRLTVGNTSTLTVEQLTTLCAEDFEMPVMCAEEPERRVIGF